MSRIERRPGATDDDDQPSPRGHDTKPNSVVETAVADLAKKAATRAIGSV